MRALEGDALSNPAVPDRCDYCGDGLCAQRCSSEVQRIIQAGAERVAACPGANCVPEEIAKLIDHTLLKPEATQAEIEKLCSEAKQYGFAAVVINPAWVSLAYRLLRGSPVVVCCVVGFPLGASSTQAKVFETRKALREGAQEIDMVINIGALKSKDYACVEDDIRAVCQAAHEGGALCKVIIEAALLSDEEKIIACSLAKSAGAEYVKTSTGFGPGGATEYDVALMRAVVGSDIGVKAAGGIKNFEQALALVKAGATRIGASAGVKILQEAKAWRARGRFGLERPAAPPRRAGPRSATGGRSY
ncbi:MAG: deoxyribose-phosphate aldolase [Chloroflexi bacterium]|nr:deoxyribose-phosphate aldolase [Chloroflexota bacterium]